MWISRIIESQINSILKTRPGLLLTGIRQAGKSALLKKMFPGAAYITLDRVLTAASAEENPKAFLNQFENQPKVILDEIQYAPSIFRELKIQIDNQRETYGKWILTGSQKFSLMQNTSESLAGRIGILTMEPLSALELRQSNFYQDIQNMVWKGGFPETWANPQILVPQYFEDYIQTYLEKDLRNLLHINSLRDFQRFIKACAVRTGQLVNFAEIAKDVGISSNTAKSWINTLESSGIIILLQPFFRNIGKRLIKSPKLYFCDQGLLCSLLNIRNYEDIKGHVMDGQIWENFVFTELIKTPGINPSKNLFFYRDQNGVEVDFLVEQGAGYSLIEAKLSESVPASKLNFTRVSKELSSQKAFCYLACPTSEDKIVDLKNYSIYNPLRSSISI